MKIKNVWNPEIKVHYTIPEENFRKAEETYATTGERVNPDRAIYYVNEEKKAVACRLQFQVWLPYENTTWRPIAMENFSGEVTAVAKCNGDDVFDVELGKKIALAKAETKAYAWALKEIEKRVAEINFFLDSVNEFVTRVEKHKDGNLFYLNRIAGLELSEEETERMKAWEAQRQGKEAIENE